MRGENSVSTSDAYVAARSSAPSFALWACLTLITAACIGWFSLDQGWFAHDEGQLGQAAARILEGQMPHRDFDDMYTGGLSYLNAFSFYLWGENSHSMRVMLFCWYLPFVAGIYWIATRFVSPVGAMLLSLLAACWSIPMYSAPMPSWYNLFFAVWITCSLLAYTQSRHRLFLVFAGLLCGLSIVIKVSGLMALAGALLFLVYDSQNPTEESSQVSNDPRARWPSFVISAGLVVFGALSSVFVSSKDPLMQFLHLALPFLALTAFVLTRELSGVARSIAGLVKLCQACLLVLAAVTIPIVAYAAFFYQQGALQPLLHGVLVAPKKRIELAAAPFPNLLSFWITIPLALLLYPSLLKSKRSSESGAGKAEPTGEGQTWMLLAVGFAALLLLRNTAFGFNLPFYSVRNMAPLLVVGNLFLLLRLEAAPVQKSTLFLLTVLPFFVSLVQFPFAGAIYFFYAAPLLLTSVLVAIHYQPWVPRKALATIAVFLIVLSCVRYHNHLPVVSLHPAYRGGYPEAQLASNRSELRIEARMANAFNRMQEVVRNHTSKDEVVFATPDAPEVNFLTGRPSLNGVMYEFFHDKLYEDLDALSRELAIKDVNLVVLKERPEFSPVVSDEFRVKVLGDFDTLETIGLEAGGETRPMFTIYKRRARKAETPTDEKTIFTSTAR